MDDKFNLENGHESKVHVMALHQNVQIIGQPPHVKPSIIIKMQISLVVNVKQINAFCFRYTYSMTPLLSKSKISSL